MINKLPNEILTQIFSHLPPPTLHEVAKVSAHWLHITRTLGAYRLDMTYLDDEPFPNETNMITDIKNEITTDVVDGVNIRHLLVLSKRLLPNDVFHFIQHLCPNVISFDYDNDLLNTTTAFQYPIQPSQCRLFYSSGWQRSIRHLAVWHDKHQQWRNDTQFCERLESLHIRHDNPLLRFIGRMYCNMYLPPLPQLDALTLQSRYKFTENDINYLLHQCPQLTALNIINASLTFNRSYIFSNDFRNTVVPKLKTLKLENVTLLNHQAFPFFPKKYPNVETMTLSTNYRHYQDRDTKRYSYGGTGACIYAMITDFKHLKKAMVHLEGFGTLDDPVEHWLQISIQTYFCHPSRKNVDVKLTFA